MEICLECYHDVVPPVQASCVCGCHGGTHVHIEKPIINALYDLAVAAQRMVESDIRGAYAAMEKLKIAVSAFNELDS